ncbi:MAG TPA: hypothetical protein PKM91_09515, partial [Cyclobacteriaceae bacterium]|nr:hypothetical protein [Cyclobacteriaceae bacterium]
VHSLLKGSANWELISTWPSLTLVLELPPFQQALIRLLPADLVVRELVRMAQQVRPASPRSLIQFFF